MELAPSPQAIPRRGSPRSGLEAGALGRASRRPHSPCPNSSWPVLSNQVDRASAGQHTRLASCERPTAAAERRVVRHRQRQIKQAQHAAAERLGIQSASRPAPPGDRCAMAQGQVEHETQRQHELDGQLRVERLPAGTAPLRRRPVSQRRLVQPQREVAAAAQPGLVRRPVRDAAAGARNAMAAGGVVLERHGRKVAARPTSGQTEHPCTNAVPRGFRRPEPVRRPCRVLHALQRRL